MQTNRMAVGLTVTLLVAGCMILLALPSSASPQLTWRIPSLDLGVPPGEQLPLRVAATAEDDLPASIIEVTPSLAPYVVSISPSTLPSLSAGSQIELELLFSIPKQEPFSEVDGTLHIKDRTTPGGKGSTRARTLPIVLTIGELLYPPDPGEAGRLSLEGIDSDGDGLRDDLQRHIVFAYPGQPDIQEGLKQYATGVQDALLHSDQASLARPDADKILRAGACLRHLLGVERGNTASAELEIEVLDTPARSQAYLRYNSNIGTRAVTVSVFGSAEDCMQTP